MLCCWYSDEHVKALPGFEGVLCRNLFLKNDKKELVLVVVKQDRKIDLSKGLPKALVTISSFVSSTQ
jgi:hypothetical protein